MRVVIVGGAGFIGRALASALSMRGVQTQVWDTAARLEAAKTALPGCSTRVFDFATMAIAPGALSGTDALLHLGCTTTPARSMDDMARDAASNIAPSVRLFQAAAAAGIPRVVFASSGGTVYGIAGATPVVEHDVGQPLCAYGVSKLAIEHYLALHADVRGISLRMANPYGAYQLGGTAVGVVAKCIAMASRNRALEVWGDGSVVRDYIAIDDVVAAFEHAIAAPDLEAGPYNIGTGVGSSVNDIIATVGRVSGRTPDVRYLAGRAYDVPAIVLDCTRFQRATGWTPRTSLHDGIAALWRVAAERSAG